MFDDVRSYLQLASGLTEVTASKAKEVAGNLIAHGMSLSTRAIPTPEVMGQVQDLADDLVTTSRNNRELLVGMIRSEVDRAVGRMGFVREDELAALRRHVQRLEKQLNDLEGDSGDSKPAAAAHDEPVGTDEPAPADEPAKKPKKKKKILVEDAGAPE